MSSFLYVLRGEPYKEGDVVPLEAAESCLGRCWEGNQLDAGFSSPYVSRRHLVIERRGDAFFAVDRPGSKHGSRINGEQLKAGVERELRHMDRIVLSDGEVELIFCSGVNPGDTLDYAVPKSRAELSFDEERFEVRLDGKLLDVAGKPYDLLRLLYKRRKCAVGEDEIRAAVWPERARDEREIPLGTDDEINTLVYRLRKELGSRASLIKNVRGRGYMLDI